MREWLAVLLVGFLGAVLCLLGLRALGLHWNLTDSVPRGLYRRTSAPLWPGQLIVFCLPENAARFGWERGYIHRVPDVPLIRECPQGYQPLLKPIAAIGGDVVELTSEAVIINGLLMHKSLTVSVDSAGRSLPHLPFGQYHLTAGEVWVLSTHRSNSWDSRYFGPIRQEFILGTATPVWVTP